MVEHCLCCHAMGSFVFVHAFFCCTLFYACVCGHGCVDVCRSALQQQLLTTMEDAATDRRELRSTVAKLAASEQRVLRLESAVTVAASGGDRTDGMALPPSLPPPMPSSSSSAAAPPSTPSRHRDRDRDRDRVRSASMDEETSELVEALREQLRGALQEMGAVRQARVRRQHVAHHVAGLRMPSHHCWCACVCGVVCGGSPTGCGGR